MTPLERIKSIQKIAIQDEETLKSFITQLRAAEYVATDTETSGLEYVEMVMAGCSFYMGGSYAFYFPVRHTTGEKQLSVDVCIEVLKTELKGKKLILHNLVFDALVYRKDGFDITTHQYFDTIVAAHLLDNNQPKKLKELAKLYFNYEQTTFDQVARAVDYNSTKVRIDVMTPYACDDAIVTYMLFEIFKPQLKQWNLENLFYNIEMPWLPALMSVTENGVKFNMDKLQSYVKPINEEIKQYEKEIYSYNKSSQMTLLGGRDNSFNIGSGDELALFLYRKLKLPIPSRTETGKAQTNYSALMELKDKHEVIKSLLRYKKLIKLRNSYVNSFPKRISKDGYWHLSYNNTNTNSGRLSGDSQQLPNIDKLSGWEKEVTLRYNIRACLTVEDDETMIAVDYKAQELRVAAFVGNDKSFKDIFEKGQDMHLKTASASYDLNLTEEQLKDGTPEHKKAKEEFYSYRNNGKTTNFQVLYGCSAWGLADSLNIPEEEAKKLIKGFKKSYPDITNEQKIKSKEAIEKGYVRTLFNRIERFTSPSNNKEKGAIERAAGNFIIQGFCSDITRIAGAKIWEEFRDTDLKIQLFVHDEIVFKCKTVNLDKYIPIIKEIMENSVNITPKLLIDIGTGRDYGEAK